MYSDTENVMTSNRTRLMARRTAAAKRIAQRLEREAARKLAIEKGGVLPVGDPAHVLESGITDRTYLAGILFADGSVHVFDRNAWDHARYARSVNRPGVRCGCDSGDAGWGFYVNDDRSVRPYFVPDEFLAGLRPVVAGLLEGRQEPTPISEAWNPAPAVPVVIERTQKRDYRAARRSEAARKAWATRRANAAAQAGGRS